MLNRKMLEILQRLDRSQHKRLRLYLTSNYFNSGSFREQTVQLYDLIMQHQALEEHPALQKEVVSKLFFQKQVFREKAKGPVDDLSSELFRLIRGFLVQEEMEREKSHIYEHLVLSRFYRKFSLEERFWQTLSLMRKVHEATPERDASFYANKLQIEEEELSFRGLHNSFEDDNNLIAAQNNLDLYYSIRKLEFACAFTYQERIAQLDEAPQQILLEAVLALSEPGGILDRPLNRIYRLIRQFLREQNDMRSPDELDNLINQYKDQIPLDKLNTLKAYYRILWVIRYKKLGDTDSLQRNFRIYKEHLEQGYFYFENQIPVHNLRNLINLALQMGEIDWVKKFLDTHQPERICGTRFPAEIHSLLVAEYYFKIKNYDESVQNLVYRNFENPSFGIAADVLLIKIYYETQNELLEFRMKALEQKVRRSKLNQRIKNRYVTFLKKLNTLIKYGWERKNGKLERLIEDVKTTEEIIGREWLLEKAREAKTPSTARL